MKRLTFAFLPFVIQFLFFLIILPIIVNSLSADNYKVFALILYIPLLIPVLTYGFTQFLISHIGLSKNKKKNVSIIINIGFNKTFILSFPSIFVFYYFTNDFYFSILLTIIFCFSLINEFFNSILLAFDQFNTSKAIKTLEYLINFLILFFLKDNLTLMKCVYVIIFSYFVSFFIYTNFFNKISILKITKLKFLTVADINLIKKSKYYFISTLSGFILFNLDVYVLAIYSDPKDFLVFQLLIKLCEMGRSVVGQIPAAYYSKFVILYKKNINDFKVLFIKLFLFISASLMFFSPLVFIYITEIFYFWQGIYLNDTQLIFFYIYFVFNIIVLIDSVPSTIVNSTNNNKNSSRISLYLSISKILVLTIFINENNVYILGIIGIICIGANSVYNLGKTRKILYHYE